jgi:hypothetical protein
MASLGQWYCRRTVAIATTAARTGALQLAIRSVRDPGLAARVAAMRSSAAAEVEWPDGYDMPLEWRRSTRL